MSSATSPFRRPVRRCSSRSWRSARRPGSVIITTNLPFGEWTTVFTDPRLCKAVVERLTYRSHIVETGTESYRFKHSLARTKEGRKTRSAGPDDPGSRGFMTGPEKRGAVRPQEPRRRPSATQRSPPDSASSQVAAPDGFPE